MAESAAPVEAIVALAIRHSNAGQLGHALRLCKQAESIYPPHPAVQQLLAVLCLEDGDPPGALRHAEESLALRPDHLPTLLIASASQRRCGCLKEAAATVQRVVELSSGHADAWFQLALVRQDLHDLDGAAAAYRRLLELTPRAEVEVNLGIVLQEAGKFMEAMLAYGRAYRMRDDTFGRIAHALATPNVGSVWLDLDDLRAALRSA